MSTVHDFPVRVNSFANTVAGDILITAVLKAATVTIDGSAVVFDSPADLSSPIPCSTFTAGLGTVAYFNAPTNWTPQNIQSELTAWYDPSDLSTLAGIGLAGATMTNKFGAGTTLTVGSADGSEANLTMGKLGGRDALSFGGNVYMTAAAANLSSGPASSQMSVFVVAQADPPLASTSASVFGFNGANDYYFTSQQTIHFRGQVASTNLGNLDGSNQRLRLTNVARNGPSIYEVYTDATDLGIVIDGSLPAVDLGTNPSSAYNGSLSLSQAFYLFTRPNGSPVARNLKGVCGEIIILNSGSAALRQACEGYLAHKWGLAAKLPSGHPFKDKAPAL